MLSLAKKVAEPAGAKVLITGIGDVPLDMGGNHILGGARMSDDPETGVVSPEGEVYGHPGLYVTDAASIPSSIGINPALTVGANALRIADALAGGAA
jgi:cholesterol oxidase